MSQAMQRVKQGHLKDKLTVWTPWHGVASAGSATVDSSPTEKSSTPAGMDVSRTQPWTAPSSINTSGGTSGASDVARSAVAGSIVNVSAALGVTSGGASASKERPLPGSTAGSSKAKNTPKLQGCVQATQTVAPSAASNYKSQHMAVLHSDLTMSYMKDWLKQQHPRGSDVIGRHMSHVSCIDATGNVVSPSAILLCPVLTLSFDMAMCM